MVLSNLPAVYVLFLPSAGASTAYLPYQLYQAREAKYTFGV